MKVLCSLAAFSVALLLTACSSTSDKGAANSARALTTRPGNIFNTRGKKTAPRKQAPQEQAQPEKEEPTTPPEEPAPATAPVPTEEQQRAAERLLAAPQPEATAPAHEESAPTEADTSALSPFSASLRMGGIAPQEDPASASDAPPPGANTVELRGLRSPKLPTSLPMNIDGKINSAQ